MRRFALLICFKHRPSHLQTHKLKISKYFHVELQEIISHLLFFKLGLFTYWNFHVSLNNIYWHNKLTVWNAYAKEAATTLSNTLILQKHKVGEVLEKYGAPQLQQQVEAKKLIFFFFPVHSET